MSDFVQVEVPITEQARAQLVTELSKTPAFFAKHHEYFKKELAEVMVQKMSIVLEGSTEEAIRDYKYQLGHLQGRVDLLTFLVDLSNPEYQATLVEENNVQG